MIIVIGYGDIVCVVVNVVGNVGRDWLDIDGLIVYVIEIIDVVIDVVDIIDINNMIINIIENINIIGNKIVITPNTKNK